jgi:hypothetical protein
MLVDWILNFYIIHNIYFKQAGIFSVCESILE